MIALELALSYSLFLLKGPEEHVASVLRSQALQTERLIKDMAPLQNEASKLREEIATIKKNEEEATKTYQVLVSNQRVPWSRLVSEVAAAPPSGITLKGMTVETTRLEIHGTTQSVEALIVYQTRLLSVKGVREVNINTLADKDFVLLVTAFPGQGI